MNLQQIYPSSAHVLSKSIMWWTPADGGMHFLLNLDHVNLVTVRKNCSVTIACDDNLFIFDAESEDTGTAIRKRLSAEARRVLLLLGWDRPRIDHLETFPEKPNT